jgi:hypothetical protein
MAGRGMDQSDSGQTPARVPQNAGNLLTARETISFSKIILVHAVSYG